MSHPTFYIPPDLIDGETGILTGDELRHARLTLRLGAGDTVRVVDGEGVSFTGRIRTMNREKGTVALTDRGVEPPLPFSLTVAMGIVKGERFDWAIQKATELGVGSFIPLLTERTETRSKGKWKRLPRLERVIVSSCKQSGRARFPSISEPVDIGNLDVGRYDTSIVFWENEAGKSLRETAEGIKAPASAIMIAGPVGGLTPQEVESLQDKGSLVAGMGPRILRTETAVTAGAALLQFLWGDMK